MHNAENVIHKNIAGCTAWKQPNEKPAAIRKIQDDRKKMPGPGDYDPLTGKAL